MNYREDHKLISMAVTNTSNDASIMTRPSFKLVSNRSTPKLDIRLNPNNITNNISWAQYEREHESVLRIYNIVVNEILGTKEIKLQQLMRDLRIYYAIPKHLIEEFIHWIQFTETIGIEFIETDGVKTPWIKARNKKNEFNNFDVEPSGEFSVFKPTKKAD